MNSCSGRQVLHQFDFGVNTSRSSGSRPLRDQRPGGATNPSPRPNTTALPSSSRSPPAALLAPAARHHDAALELLVLQTADAQEEERGERCCRRRGDRRRAGKPSWYDDEAGAGGGAVPLLSPEQGVLLRDAAGQDVWFDCLKVMLPELKLRPIFTRPPAAAKKNGSGDCGLDSGTSAAASPMRRRRRLDVKGRADAQVLAVTTGRHARRRWLYESLLVVKESGEDIESFF